MNSFKKNKKSLYEISKPSKYREKISESLSVLVTKYLSKNPELEESNCPFCQSKESNMYFSLQSMIYLRCVNCNSVYNSPRPTLESLDNFYKLQEKMQSKHLQIHLLQSFSTPDRSWHLFYKYLNLHK